MNEVRTAALKARAHRLVSEDLKLTWEDKVRFGLAEYEEVEEVEEEEEDGIDRRNFAAWDVDEIV